MAGTDLLCLVLERIRNDVGESKYETWFGDAVGFSLSGRRLIVSAPNAFVAKWIHGNFNPQLTAAMRDLLGQEAEVSVEVKQSVEVPSANAVTAGAPASRATGQVGSAPAAPVASAIAIGASALIGGPAGTIGVPSPAGRSAPRIISALPRLGDPRALTPAAPKPAHNLIGALDSFVVGPSNELAFSAARAIVRSPCTSFKHLVIYGGCGLGKTHLLQGICNGTAGEHPALEWLYISGEQFTNEFVQSVRNNRGEVFRSRFRHVDLLVIDDVHFLASRKATQDEFLHTFNAIDASGKTVVMSSDRHPKAISAFSEPLQNRLLAAMIVEVEAPELETRREILRRRAHHLRCDPPAEVIEYLARHIARNVRELEGALYKLVALANLNKQQIDLALARRAVEDLTTPVRAPRSTDIETLVCAFFGVTRDAMHSNSRERTITLARGIFFYLMRKHTRLSFPEIGRSAGDKNHSTVLMAVKRIQRAIDNSEQVCWRVGEDFSESTYPELLTEIERQMTKP
jgi:chromosomal replication initiator protein